MIELLEVAMSCLTLIVLAGCAVGNAMHKRVVRDALIRDGLVEEPEPEPKPDNYLASLFAKREALVKDRDAARVAFEHGSADIAQHRIGLLDSAIAERKKAKAGG